MRRSNELPAARRARQCREFRQRKKLGLPSRRKTAISSALAGGFAKAQAEIRMGRMPSLPAAVHFRLGKREVVVVGRQTLHNYESHGDVVAKHQPIGSTVRAFGFLVGEKTYLWI
jgi:hypothetical protein